MIFKPRDELFEQSKRRRRRTVILLIVAAVVLFLLGFIFACPILDLFRG